MSSLSRAIDSAPLPANERVVETLEESWQAVGEPGTWLTGHQRVAAAREARAAGACELCAARADAVSPYAIAGEHPGVPGLDDALVDAVHRMTTDPGRLSSAWYLGLAQAGVSDEVLVEVVGVVSTVIAVDTYCRAIGAPLPAVPEPADGSPAPETPSGAAMHSAWVPTVVPEQAEGRVARLYEAAKSNDLVPNVFRALTLVPAEAERHRARAVALYPPAADILNPQLASALQRPQIELIAATVSAANDCFY